MTPRRPRPAPVSHGCRQYEHHGVYYTRCPAHQPADARDCGPVTGACVVCANAPQTEEVGS